MLADHVEVVDELASNVRVDARDVLERVGCENGKLAGSVKQKKKAY